MEWLLDHEADLVSWRLTDDRLELEMVTGPCDPLPESPVPVLVLTVAGLKACPPTLEADLTQLAREGLWNVGREASDPGIRVMLEGEGWSLDLSCDTLDQSRVPLQARHYERIISQQKAVRDQVWSAERALRSQLARVEAFIQEQITRANRILAETTSSQGASRSRAEGRLRLAHELRNIIGSSSHAD